jgi:hypothetical protein
MLRRRGGRPPIGSAATTVESVRLDPDLREALTQCAARDHETTSSVIRKALRRYLGDCLTRRVARMGYGTMGSGWGGNLGEKHANPEKKIFPLR